MLTNLLLDLRLTFQTLRAARGWIDSMAGKTNPVNGLPLDVLHCIPA